MKTKEGNYDLTGLLGVKITRNVLTGAVTHMILKFLGTVHKV